MSRSQPNHRIPNPARLFAGYNASSGVFSFYDSERKEVVTLPLPLTFLWLDELKKLGGFDADSKSRLYSNEVRDLDESFTLRSFKGGIVVKGLYRDIKDKVEASGGSFYTSIYIALKRDEQWVLANLSLKGAALAAWIEFARKRYKDIEEKAIVVNGSVEDRTGSVTFRVPKFELVEAPPSAHSAAMLLDGELQTYLRSYFGRAADDRAEDRNGTEQETVTADQIPF